MNRLLRKSLDYYILNVSVLPAAKNTSEYYSALFKKVFDLGLSVNVNGDFAYRISEFSSYKKGEAFYGNIAKSVLLRDVKWVKKGTNEKIAFNVPEDHEARKGVYEFLLIPDQHRIALVRTGKINSDLEDKIAGNFRIISEFLKVVLDEVLAKEGKTVDLNIVQKEEIFDRIFESQVKNLYIQVSYSNPGLDGDRDPSVDEMLREAHAGKTELKVKADSTGEIDTSSKFIKGFLDLAQTDGSAIADVINIDGRREKIRTAKHPKLVSSNVRVDRNGNAMFKFIADILSNFGRNIT